jgi:hypothetical protein
MGRGRAMGEDQVSRWVLGEDRVNRLVREHRVRHG